MSNNKEFTKKDAVAGLVMGIVFIIADVALQANGILCGVKVFHVIPISLWIVGALSVVYSLITLGKEGS